jgi:hypothetical protein
MMPQPISVTPPEITFRLPTLGEAEEGRDKYHSQAIHQAWINYFLWQLLKNVGYTSALNAENPPHSIVI